MISYIKRAVASHMNKSLIASLLLFFTKIGMIFGQPVPCDFVLTTQETEIKMPKEVPEALDLSSVAILESQTQKPKGRYQRTKKTAKPPYIKKPNHETRIVGSERQKKWLLALKEGSKAGDPESIEKLALLRQKQKEWRRRAKERLARGYGNQEQQAESEAEASLILANMYLAVHSGTPFITSVEDVSPEDEDVDILE